MYANSYHAYRLTTMGASRRGTGVAGMVAKLYGSTLAYELAKLAMDIVADVECCGRNAHRRGYRSNSYMQAFACWRRRHREHPAQRHRRARLGLPRGPTR